MRSDQNKVGVKTSAMGADFGKYAICLAMFVAACVFYVLNFGFYPKNLIMEWDEEVKLHDGRMIIVHRTSHFERRGLRLQRYPDNRLDFGFVSEKFSFEAGPSRVFSHTFVSGGLSFLHEVEGKWYVGYIGDQSQPSNRIGNSSTSPRVAVLESGGELRKVAGWPDIPAVITDYNILRGGLPPSLLASFQGQILRHKEKVILEGTYSSSPDWDKINRRP
jgi:hypothetical protein